MGERTIVDLTGDRMDLIAALIPAMSGCTVAVALHSPWNEEVGYLVFDDEELPVEITADDILVTATRGVRGDHELAIALADAFFARLDAL